MMASKFEHGTRFRNLGSHSEVVNVMLQGLSSKMELSAGVMREVV